VYSESVCQVSRNWVDVGSFHKRLFFIFMIFYSVSPEYFGYTLLKQLVYFMSIMSAGC
jgi:hypothetical protein